ncbi:hypothetical protein BKA70DRAFT_1110926 [Coprinopsis sp. MPI-PUGE-AT-0042]|nr:hypothetical protein BKA70DRAFT_1110926 [Coprinopsis sp. MPI-PUGE-AT-0042]
MSGTQEECPGRYGTVAPEHNKRPASPSHESPLNPAPRKKASVVFFIYRTCAKTLTPSSKKGDIYNHHGRIFGQTVFAFCNVRSLLYTGLQFEAEPDKRPEGFENRRDFRVYKKLLAQIKGLEDQLLSGKDEDTDDIARAIESGIHSARADDTKGLKGAIVEWLHEPGRVLNPPIPSNSKDVRGFHHRRTATLLFPAPLENWSKVLNKTLIIEPTDWPAFLYANEQEDPEDVWKGLFRGELLVRAYRYIFTSPSSAHSSVRATRAGNAKLHGIKSVTRASLAYVAMQVRFALSSSNTFTANDPEFDLATFYNSMLDLLEDHQEQKEVEDLLRWWNHQIFLSFVQETQRVARENSTLAKIRARHEALTNATNRAAELALAPSA